VREREREKERERERERAKSAHARVCIEVVHPDTDRAVAQSEQSLEETKKIRLAKYELSPLLWFLPLLCLR
jgi:hypothetical protein